MGAPSSPYMPNHHMHSCHGASGSYPYCGIPQVITTYIKLTTLVILVLLICVPPALHAASMVHVQKSSKVLHGAPPLYSKHYSVLPTWRGSQACFFSCSSNHGAIHEDKQTVIQTDAVDSYHSFQKGYHLERATGNPDGRSQVTEISPIIQYTLLCGYRSYHFIYINPLYAKLSLNFDPSQLNSFPYKVASSLVVTGNLSFFLKHLPVKLLFSRVTTRLVKVVTVSLAYYLSSCNQVFNRENGVGASRM